MISKLLSPIRFYHYTDVKVYHSHALVSRLRELPQCSCHPCMLLNTCSLALWQLSRPFSSHPR